MPRPLSTVRTTTLRRDEATPAPTVLKRTLSPRLNWLANVSAPMRPRARGVPRLHHEPSGEQRVLPGMRRPACLAAPRTRPRMVRSHIRERARRSDGEESDWQAEEAGG